jgi:hypothetical protein
MAHPLRLSLPPILPQHTLLLPTPNGTLCTLLMMKMKPGRPSGSDSLGNNFTKKSRTTTFSCSKSSSWNGIELRGIASSHHQREQPQR